MKQIFIGLLLVTYLIVGLLAFNVGSADGFLLGLSEVSDSYETCSTNDNSGESFPKYFKACKELCKTLYNDNPICVSLISGGSVTCVCEQTESK